MAPRQMRVMPNSVFFNTSSCKDPPVGFWLPSSVMSIVVCFKGRIYRWMLKSPGVWDATYPFTLRLPPGVTFNGVFCYFSFCTHPTVGYWLPRTVVDKVVCFKGCISRCAVKSPVFERQHIHSHLDFPQELCSTASSITHLPARIKQFVLGCQGLWVGMAVLKSTWRELLCSLLMF